MKKGKLKAAVVLGSAALLWSIPSLNIFGIIGAIMSWAAYGGGRRKTAQGAGVFYIVSLLVSIAAGVGLALIAGSLPETESVQLVAKINIFAVMSVFGDVIYAAAAVCSFKGAKDLIGAEGKGFFD